MPPDALPSRLVGLDVGSTTTSILVASARLVRNCVTGRNELGEVKPVFRPDPVFTPFLGDALDIKKLERQLDDWLAGARLDPASVTTGGALVTGLAALASNAAAVKQLVRRRFQQAIVATANDPCLESWLAFMGNTLSLSRAEPKRAFINLDIGGGTTNIAWGVAGEVRRCGCYYVGARHIQVEPGSYRMRSLSPFAKELVTALGLTVAVGNELNPHDLDLVMGFYIAMLEAIVTGRPLPAPVAAAQTHCQVEFTLPESHPAKSGDSEPVITVSGGVGELAYANARGGTLPGTTAFGDLGNDLAQRICQSPILSRNLTSHVPSGLGRATVQGLTAFSTEVSGASLFLPNPEILPLTDLPILGNFGPETSDEDLGFMVSLAARAREGSCLRVHLESDNTPAVKSLGQRLAKLLEQTAFPSTKPLVLLTAGNIGKTLGQYATRWGRDSIALVVIDEVPDRQAQFASIGKPCDGLIPVSFHGLEARLE